MSRPIRNSRWRRLPGAHRILEKKLPDHRTELQRLTLYLPGAVLDQAEQLAIREGASSVQDYCEGLLRRVIEAEAARSRVERVEAAQGSLESFDELTSDPEYLVEWSARSAASEPLRLEGKVTPKPETEIVTGADWMSESDQDPRWIVPDQSGSELTEAPEAVVLRHAGLGPEDPWAVLPTLRRGEPIPPASASELLQALVALEGSLLEADQINRRLCYGLHRLAFEGQVLLTDAWPALAADQATLDVLRMVQESVDRILSGEDIRYHDRLPESEPPR